MIIYTYEYILLLINFKIIIKFTNNSFKIVKNILIIRMCKIKIQNIYYLFIFNENEMIFVSRGFTDKNQLLNQVYKPVHSTSVM